MKNSLGFWGWCALAFSVLAPATNCQALIIDNFSSGQLSSGPGNVSLDGVQAGLDGAQVLGGGRKNFSLYGGSFEIGAGEWTLDHDRSFFEVVQMQYGGAFEASLPMLNADIGSAGDQVVIRVAEATIQGMAHAPIGMSITFVTGEGTPTRSGTGAWFELETSDEAYTLAIPFESFTNQVDLSDVDGVSVSVFFPGQARLTLDEIVVAPRLAGDYDANGVIDASDFAEFTRFYGSTAPVAADGNQDGIVDAADYTILRDALETSSASVANPAAIPEPTGLCLVLIMAVVVGSSRWSGA